MSSESNVRAWDAERRHLDRLETLIDVLFAILIWRVVMRFPIPSGDESMDLLVFYTGNWDDLLVVAIGMVLTTLYWVQNSVLLGQLDHTDGRHAVLSVVSVFFLLLYLVCLRVGTEFTDLLALTLQSAMLAASGFTSVAAFSYAMRDRRLLRADVSDEEASQLRRRYLAEPLAAVVSLPFSFLGPILWEISWLSLPLFTRLLRPGQRVPPAATGAPSGG
jgi:uncharacterized membrane protein